MTISPNFIDTCTDLKVFLFNSFFYLNKQFFLYLSPSRSRIIDQILLSINRQEDKKITADLQKIAS